MILIDSSSWIHQLRQRGNEKIRSRVNSLLASGLAAWCPVIRLELWNGVGSEPDRQTLREYEQSLPELPITDEIWQEACELADRCRKAGKTAPAADLLIAACARHHNVTVEAEDKHFEFLMKL